MPGGQSGHPWSPFYRAGHEAWVRGEPTLSPGLTLYAAAAHRPTGKLARSRITTVYLAPTNEDPP